MGCKSLMSSQGWLKRSGAVRYQLSLRPEVTQALRSANDDRPKTLSFVSAEVVRSKLDAKPLTIFAGADKRLYHFRVLEITVEEVQLVKPEVIASRVRIAPQITEVFHGHERGVELAIL